MERQTVRNQLELWQELPSLVELSQPEGRPAPPSLWRIGNKSLFETNNRVRRRANKRLSLRRRTLPLQAMGNSSEHQEEEEEEEEEDEIEREEECEEDSDSDDELPLLINFEAEEEDDYDSDDDSLPDLVSASEDEEDFEDEGIADCDTFISMDSLLVLLGRYGLNDHQDQN